MKGKTVAESLTYVSEHQIGEITVDTPVWEIIGHTLFHIANNPDRRVRGSMGRANRARKIILERMVGRRRPGTHPAQANNEELEFVDLTQPAVSK